MSTTSTRELESAQALLAIAQAARKAGYRDLELDARRKLLEEHGIRLSFRGAGEEVQHGQR